MTIKGAVSVALVIALCTGAASVIYLRWQEFAPMAGWVN